MCHVIDKMSIGWESRLYNSLVIYLEGVITKGTVASVLSRVQQDGQRLVEKEICIYEAVEVPAD